MRKGMNNEDIQVVERSWPWLIPLQSLPPIWENDTHRLRPSDHVPGSWPGPPSLCITGSPLCISLPSLGVLPRTLPHEWLLPLFIVPFHLWSSWILPFLQPSPKLSHHSLSYKPFFFSTCPSLHRVRGTQRQSLDGSGPLVSKGLATHMWKSHLTIQGSMWPQKRRITVNLHASTSARPSTAI